MNQAVKEQWLSALRSGEYKQGKKTLRPGDTFCCLGVLCDLHAKAHDLPWSEPRNRRLGGDMLATHDYLGNSGTLPERVADWARISQNPETKDHKPLAVLNDEGLGFKELAEIIEREF